MRLNIFPDGGARLRVHGEPVPDWAAILAGAPDVNVSAIEHGGRHRLQRSGSTAIRRICSMPYRAANMGDGWETRRRRGPGHDWAILRLGIQAVIRASKSIPLISRATIRTAVPLDAALVAGEPGAGSAWEEVLPQTTRTPRPRTFELRLAAPASHVRLNMYPDGGIAARAFGTPTRDGRMREGLRALNSMDDASWRAALTNCCGSSTWVEQMIAGRPFKNLVDPCSRSQRVMDSLRREDWLEAFAHHPRIGDRARSDPVA